MDHQADPSAMVELFSYECHDSVMHSLREAHGGTSCGEASNRYHGKAA
jgi:hypothetical protein